MQPKKIELISTNTKESHTIYFDANFLSLIDESDFNKNELLKRIAKILANKHTSILYAARLLRTKNHEYKILYMEDSGGFFSNTIKLKVSEEKPSLMGEVVDIYPEDIPSFFPEKNLKAMQILEDFIEKYNLDKKNLSKDFFKGEYFAPIEYLCPPELPEIPQEPAADFSLSKTYSVFNRIKELDEIFIRYQKTLAKHELLQKQIKSLTHNVSRESNENLWDLIGSEKNYLDQLVSAAISKNSKTLTYLNSLFTELKPTLSQLYLEHENANIQLNFIKQYLGWAVSFGINSYLSHLQAETEGSDRLEKIKRFNQHFGSFIEIYLENGVIKTNLTSLYDNLQQKSLEEIELFINNLLKECDTSWMVSSDKLKILCQYLSNADLSLKQKILLDPNETEKTSLFSVQEKDLLHSPSFTWTETALQLEKEPSLARSQGENKIFDEILKLSMDLNLFYPTKSDSDFFSKTITHLNDVFDAEDNILTTVNRELTSFMVKLAYCQQLQSLRKRLQNLVNDITDLPSIAQIKKNQQEFANHYAAIKDHFLNYNVDEKSLEKHVNDLIAFLTSIHHAKHQIQDCYKDPHHHNISAMLATLTDEITLLESKKLNAKEANHYLGLVTEEVNHLYATKYEDFIEFNKQCLELTHKGEQYSFNFEELLEHEHLKNNSVFLEEVDLFKKTKENFEELCQVYAKATTENPLTDENHYQKQLVILENSFLMLQTKYEHLNNYISRLHLLDNLIKNFEKVANLSQENLNALKKSVEQYFLNQPDHQNMITFKLSRALKQVDVLISNLNQDLLDGKKLDNPTPAQIYALSEGLEQKNMELKNHFFEINNLLNKPQEDLHKPKPSRFLAPFRFIKHNYKKILAGAALGLGVAALVTGAVALTYFTMGMAPALVFTGIAASSATGLSLIGIHVSTTVAGILAYTGIGLGSSLLGAAGASLVAKVKGRRRKSLLQQWRDEKPMVIESRSRDEMFNSSQMFNSLGANGKYSMPEEEAREENSPDVPHEKNEVMPYTDPEPSYSIRPS